MSTQHKSLRRLTDLGEFGLINKIKKLAGSSSEVVCGIGDDTAVLSHTSKMYRLLTTDMISEDVHFNRTMNFKEIGFKAMNSNISDIAAMGGLPRFALLSIGIPLKEKLRNVDELIKGISQQAKKFSIEIIGGDTIRSEKLVINICLIGDVFKKHLVRRSTAKAGDKILVTGHLGRSYQSGRHLTFIPRVKESQFLINNFKPSAMMDLSDGLGNDLNHLLKASGIGANIFEEKIPRHKRVSLKQALYDGEDFELLFMLSPQKANKLKKIKSKFFFKEIGVCTKGKKCQLFLEDGTNQIVVFGEGFQHF